MGADRRWAFVQPVWLGKVTRIFWLFALGVLADIPLGSNFGGFLLSALWWLHPAHCCRTNTARVQSDAAPRAAPEQSALRGSGGPYFQAGSALIKINFFQFSVIGALPEFSSALL